MMEIFTGLADFLTGLVPGLDDTSHAYEALHFFIEDTTKIFFLLTVMVFAIGFFRSWLSPEKVRSLLERCPPLAAYGLAVLLGAVTPFCSCSSVPLFIGFLSAGIPLGVTMAFLITSPMVNEVATLLFAATLGWSFTLAYVGVGMGVGLIGGLLIDRLRLEKWVEPFVFTLAAPNEDDSTPQEKPSFSRRRTLAWRETCDILRRVWLYVLIGVGAGALIHGFVPQDWIVAHAGSDNLFAVPLAVLSGIPLYSNAAGLVPVAESLMAKGLPTGTTLAFLMSTVAISLPELLILRRVLKPEMLVFFVCYLAVAFIMTGYVFNALF